MVAESRIVEVPTAGPETWNEATWRAVETWAFAAPARTLNPIVAWFASLFAILGSSASFGFGLGGWTLWFALAAATVAALFARSIDLGRFGGRPQSSWVWLPSRYPTNHPPATLEPMREAALPYLPEGLDSFLRDLGRRATRLARDGADPDTLELKIDDALWRARLFPHGALLAGPHGRPWLPLARSRMHLEMAEKLGIPPDVLYHARLGGMETIVEMQPDVYARYTAWRGKDD